MNITIRVKKDKTIHGAIEKLPHSGLSHDKSIPSKRGLVNQAQKVANPSTRFLVNWLPISKNSPIILYPFFTSLMMVNMIPKNTGTNRSIPNVSPGKTRYPKRLFRASKDNATSVTPVDIGV